MVSNESEFLALIDRRVRRCFPLAHRIASLAARAKVQKLSLAILSKQFLEEVVATKAESAPQPPRERPYANADALLACILNRHQLTTGHRSKKEASQPRKHEEGGDA